MANTGNIPNNIALGAGQSVRRNAGDTAFEAFTISGTNTGDQDLSSYVVGPASSTDNAIARFDSTTGKLIQNSGVTISDGNVITATGIITPEVMASSSAGVDIHNNSMQQVALFGAGGGTGSSLVGTTNIGSGSADYHQLTGGTGTITDTATGSSTDIDINLVPKGAGRLKEGGVSILNTNSTLNDLSDVTVPTPATGDSLVWSGTAWISEAPSSVVGSAVTLYLDETVTFADNFTLSTTPSALAEDIDTVSVDFDVNAGITFIERYVSEELGATSIPAGTWDFHSFVNLSSITGDNYLYIRINKRCVQTGITGTFTGAGATRTFTVTGGTPFVAGDVGDGTILTATLIETATQTAWISGFTSSSVVTVTLTDPAFVNTSGVSLDALYYLLFGKQSPDITTAGSVVNLDYESIQPAFTVDATDRIVAAYFAKTTSITARNFSLYHGGSTNYTRFVTPIVTKHNQLDGLNEGDYKHLTATEYTGTGTGVFARATSPSFTTPILGTPTSGTLTNCTFPTLNQNTSGYAEALKSATTTVSVSAATAPSNGQVLTATSSTTATWQTPSAGGLTWNATANGATGTGLALTMDNSYAASGIGQSIIAGNTQTNAVTLLSLDTGTSSILGTTALKISGLGTASTGRALFEINYNVGATQANANCVFQGLDSEGTFNTNSTFDSVKLRIRNAQNAGTGYNTGIQIQNSSAEYLAGSAGLGKGVGLNIYQAGVGGTAFSINTTPNLNSSTNGLVNYTLDNTQSAVSVMQKIDLGSSAQAHNGIKIVGTNASSTAVSFNADMGTGYTGKFFRGALNSVENFSVASSGDIITLGTIELGHATDTTISRVSAGVVAIEGVNIVKAGAVTTNGITMSTSRLLGRSTASTGAIEEITLGTGLSFSGTTLNASGGGSTSYWTEIPGTPTRASNTTFTITGDYTAVFKKGMIIKWEESTVVRNAMISIPSTYSAPNTTITIIGDTMASIDASSCKYTFQEAVIKEFAVAGSIGATGTDVARAYYAPYPMRVLGADLQTGTAGTTNSTTVDINKGGTTMFTTKPTLATTVASSPTPFTADTATSLALGDKVTMDIDAFQTTNAVDLYVQLYMIPTRINFLT